MDPCFAREPRGGKGNRELGRAGERKLDPGSGGAVRVVQREDTGRAVPLDGAPVIGVYERTDEEGREECAEDQESDVLSERPSMRQVAHQSRAYSGGGERSSRDT